MINIAPSHPHHILEFESAVISLKTNSNPLSLPQPSALPRLHSFLRGFLFLLLVGLSFPPAYTTHLSFFPFPTTNISNCSQEHWKSDPCQGIIAWRYLSNLCFPFSILIVSFLIATDPPTLELADILPRLRKNPILDCSAAAILFAQISVTLLWINFSVFSVNYLMPVGLIIISLACLMFGFRRRQEMARTFTVSLLEKFVFKTAPSIAVTAATSILYWEVDLLQCLSSNSYLFEPVNNGPKREAREIRNCQDASESITILCIMISTLFFLLMFLVPFQSYNLKNVVAFDFTLHDQVMSLALALCVNLAVFLYSTMNPEIGDYDEWRKEALVPRQWICNVFIFLGLVVLISCLKNYKTSTTERESGESAPLPSKWHYAMAKFRSAIMTRRLGQIAPLYRFCIFLSTFVIFFFSLLNFYFVRTEVSSTIVSLSSLLLLPLTFSQLFADKYNNSWMALLPSLVTPLHFFVTGWIVFSTDDESTSLSVTHTLGGGILLLCFCPIVAEVRNYFCTHSEEQVNKYYQDVLALVAATVIPTIFLTGKIFGCFIRQNDISLECKAMSESYYSVIQNMVS